MERRRHSYFKDDIRKTLLLYAFIPAVLLTFLLLFMFWGYWKIDVERTTKSENNLLTSEVSKTVSSYMDFAEGVAKDESILMNGSSNTIKAKIFNEFYGVSNSLGRTAYLYVLDAEYNPIISGKKSLPYFLDGKSYSNWGIYWTMKKDPKDIAVRVINGDSNEMELIIGKSIIVDGKIKGYVVITLESSQFLIQLSKLQSQSIMTDANGQVFLTNNYDFLDNLQRFSLHGSEPVGRVSTENSSYHFRSSKILGGKLYIYSIKTISNQVELFTYLGLTIIFVFTLMVVLVLYSTKRMAINKTKDLDKITSAFEMARSGDLETRVNLDSNDEFEAIAESFNVMVESLKVQSERNQEMTERLSISQIKQLQSQFNPHFIYNTLDNIRFMSKFDGESASTMTLNLSTILRYSLDNTQEVVTLNEDIVYTDNYLSIMKYRYNRRFNYDIDIPEEFLDCLIPKLIIQPMIENAVKYGFEKQDELRVYISCKRMDDYLVLICKDNGFGMEEETLKNIRLLLVEEVNESTHSGLYNIHRRIQLRYGKAYGITIESSLNEGTELRVFLPIVYKNSRNTQEGLDA
ncbi:MAG: histidine kinase [Clostridiaceae bacterium]